MNCYRQLGLTVPLLAGFGCGVLPQVEPGSGARPQEASSSGSETSDNSDSSGDSGVSDGIGTEGSDSSGTDGPLFHDDFNATEGSPPQMPLVPNESQWEYSEPGSITVLNGTAAVTGECELTGRAAMTADQFGVYDLDNLRIRFAAQRGGPPTTLLTVGINAGQSPVGHGVGVAWQGDGTLQVQLNHKRFGEGVALGTRPVRWYVEVTFSPGKVAVLACPDDWGTEDDPGCLRDKIDFEEIDEPADGNFVRIEANQCAELGSPTIAIDEIRVDVP